eukprot:Gb_03073 [translate_table: standard]
MVRRASDHLVPLGNATGADGITVSPESSAEASFKINATSSSIGYKPLTGSEGDEDAPLFNECEDFWIPINVLEVGDVVSMAGAKECSGREINAEIKVGEELLSSNMAPNANFDEEGSSAMSKSDASTSWA